MWPLVRRLRPCTRQTMKSVEPRRHYAIVSRLLVNSYYGEIMRAISRYILNWRIKRLIRKHEKQGFSSWQNDEALTQEKLPVSTMSLKLEYEKKLSEETMQRLLGDKFHLNQPGR